MRVKENTFVLLHMQIKIVFCREIMHKTPKRKPRGITILKGIYSLMEGIIKDEEKEKREKEEMGGGKTVLLSQE